MTYVTNGFLLCWYGFAWGTQLTTHSRWPPNNLSTMWTFNMSAFFCGYCRGSERIGRRTKITVIAPRQEVFFLPECYAACVHCCLVCSCHSQQQDVAIQRETWLGAVRLRGFKINRRQDGLHFIPHPPFLYPAICCILCGLLIKTNLFSLHCECWQNTKVNTNYNMKSLSVKLFVETSLETWWYCGDRWLNKPELIWPLGTNTLTFFFMLVFQWLE